MIKARAFHADWTPSAVSSANYTIDAAAPTITASRFPAAIDGWHNTATTITFNCQDNVVVATCSEPSTVSSEGAGQIVSGTAVDHAGREATLQEAVNVDLTPPIVTLISPVDSLATASSSVEVSAQVSDALSGLGVVNCNGVASPVVDGVVTCTATLRPGRNSITVSARDVAGNSSSAGATVTLAGTPTWLTLTPTNRLMLVGESATLSLRNNFGVPVSAATWVSSMPWNLSLSADDPPVLTALGTGTITITATKNGLSTSATVTVVSDPNVPEGTTRWTVAPTPAPNTSWLEGPIYTHRIDASVPDLFMVETNTSTFERTLRAVSESGEADWIAASPGVPLMGDSFGGVIAGVEPAPNHCLGPFNQIQRCYTALARFAGPAGTASWRYESSGLLDRPAQSPDGTVYVIEHLGDHLYQPNNTGNAFFPFPGQKVLVILDGATGAVTARVPLEGDPDREPVTIGPIVGSDGYGYVLTTKELQITLHQLSRAGEVASAVIVPATCSGTQCRQPVPSQLLPDGLGGLLITADWGNASYLTADNRMTRFDSDWNRTDTTLPSNTGRIELIGQGGTAYLRQTTGGSVFGTTVSQPVMDISTWTTRWTLPVEWKLLAAAPDGGAVAQNAAGDIARFDGTGQLLSTTPAVAIRNPVQEFGQWLGSSDHGMRAMAGTFDDATRWNETYSRILFSSPERYGFGGRPGNLAQRHPGQGIFAKTHYALHDYSALGIPLSWALRFRHVSIRIVPRDQAYWFDQMGAHLSGPDTFGNWFFTLGAGMGDSDTSTACSGGPLKKGINRTNDIGTPSVDPLEQLGFPPSQERAVIQRVLTRYNAYDDSLPYNCFPEGYDTFGVPPHPGTWNSNSFAAGLIKAAGLQQPRMPRAMFRLFPGWATPVPVDKFQ